MDAKKMNGEDREQHIGTQMDSMRNGNTNDLDSRRNSNDNSGMHAGGSQGSAYNEPKSTGENSRNQTPSHASERNDYRNTSERTDNDRQRSEGQSMTSDSPEERR